jgi:hypothetical protein
MKTETLNRVNGLDLETLGTFVEEIKNDASKGLRSIQGDLFVERTNAEVRLE